MICRQRCPELLLSHCWARAWADQYQAGQLPERQGGGIGTKPTSPRPKARSPSRAPQRLWARVPVRFSRCPTKRGGVFKTNAQARGALTKKRSTPATSSEDSHRRRRRWQLSWIWASFRCQTPEATNEEPVCLPDTFSRCMRPMMTQTPQNAVPAVQIVLLRRMQSNCSKPVPPSPAMNEVPSYGARTWPS